MSGGMSRLAIVEEGFELRASAQERVRRPDWWDLALNVGKVYVPFVIELSARKVHVAGCTPNPNDAWVIQQAAYVGWDSMGEHNPWAFHPRARRQVHSTLRQRLSHRGRGDHTRA